MSQPLQRIRSLLDGHPWSEQIHYFESVDSTNTLAKTMAASGAPAGTVLIADRQTAGRGRMGRSFLSPRGMGVYLSLILRPDCPPAFLMHLTCAAAVAACDAVENAYGFRPKIKWTNDLVWGRKKLAGILTELSLDPKTGKVDHAVIGIGVNCRQTTEDLDPSIRDMACSARMIAGDDVDREALCAQLIRSFYTMDQGLFSQKNAIMERYRSDCMTVGQHISIQHGDQFRHGVATGITDDGSLAVTYDDQSRGIVQSGEVSVRGLYGYV